MCLYCEAKYQIVSSKAVERVDWPMYAVFKHKHNPYLKASWKKKVMFTKLSFFSIINFLAPNFIMQMFNVSILCRQSIRLFHQKLWYDLIGPCMHYLSTSITPVYKKAGKKVHKSVILSIMNVLATNFFFMQMYNVSILCRQSIRLFHQKLWYNWHAYALPMHQQNPLKVKYKGILFYEILMDCVARKRMQKTTSIYLKWFPRYCDLNFYKLSH